MKRTDVKVGFERKMVEMRGFAQPFKFDVSIEGGKQVIGLGSDGLGG